MTAGSVGARLKAGRDFVEIRKLDFLDDDDWFPEVLKPVCVDVPVKRVVSGWRSKLEITRNLSKDERREVKLRLAKVRRSEWTEEQRLKAADAKRVSYAKNPELYAAMKAAWASENPEKMMESRKKWRAENRQHELLKRREWYQRKKLERLLK